MGYYGTWFDDERLRKVVLPMTLPLNDQVLSSFRFEFDPVNKILLLRVEGRITDSVQETLYSTARKYWAATGARAGIADYSGVTDFAVSGNLVLVLAQQKPPMPDPATMPLFIVMPTLGAYGLGRMFQLASESSLPLVHVVRAMNEALAALGVHSPQFQPPRDLT